MGAIGHHENKHTDLHQRFDIYNTFHKTYKPKITNHVTLFCIVGLVEDIIYFETLA